MLCISLVIDSILHILLIELATSDVSGHGNYRNLVDARTPGSNNKTPSLFVNSIVSTGKSRSIQNFVVHFAKVHVGSLCASVEHVLHRRVALDVHEASPMRDQLVQ